MRILFITLVFVISFCAQGSVIILEGVYQGQNLFIQNPFGNSTSEFCIDEVLVNGSTVVKAPKISALEIKLDRFEINDPLKIEIFHKDDCTPNIINPHAVVFEKDFEFIYAQANPQGIAWSTVGEESEGRFEIEEFKNQRWTPIDSVKQQSGFEQSDYFRRLLHDKGVNKYRVVYYRGAVSKYSNEFEYLSKKDPVTFYPKEVTNKITLSEKTFYEIYDKDYNQVTKGEGKEINLINLPKGTY